MRSIILFSPRSYGVVRSIEIPRPVEGVEVPGVGKVFVEFGPCSTARRRNRTSRAASLTAMSSSPRISIPTSTITGTFNFTTLFLFLVAPNVCVLPSCFDDGGYFCIS